VDTALSDRQTFELVDFIRMDVGEDPAKGAILTGRTEDAQSIDLHLTPAAVARLETFLVRANMEQPKRQPSH
jgi:hypothetical protein